MLNVPEIIFDVKFLRGSMNSGRPKGGRTLVKLASQNVSCATDKMSQP